MVASYRDTPEAIRADLDSMLAAAGRARHMRRQLEAAAEHGAALLAALDLPRLVMPDFVPLDRAEIGAALDRALAVLDALDGDPDLEDEAEDDEADGSDEHSLGWREAVAQLDLGQASDDGEHTLGAPERCPWSPAMGASFYKPARGLRLQRCFVTRAWNQVAWSAGANVDGEGETEPGYDLPEGDDEKCGSEHSGAEPDETDQNLGSATGDGDQRRWAQGEGSDHEAVNEDGGDEHREPATRPISPRRVEVRGYFEHREIMRALGRRAEATRRRVKAVPAAPDDPDTVTPAGPGMLWMRRPSLCNVHPVAVTVVAAELSNLRMLTL